MAKSNGGPEERDTNAFVQTSTRKQPVDQNRPSVGSGHPQVRPLQLTPRRRAWITFGVMMGLFLGALEATVMATAMPTVISTLGGLEIYSWVYSVYFLMATVTVPLWGRLSDLYGRRVFYLAGIVFFLGGSVFCGVSQSMTQLIFSRAIQGLGAGALIPLGMTIVGDIYSLEGRARIQGLFSGVWGLSSVVGPLLGGLITDYLSWRWVFFLNIPFGLAAGVIIGTVLVDPPLTRKRQVDYCGALLLLLSLSSLLLGLDQWRTDGFSMEPFLFLLGALLTLVLFVILEIKKPDPILPLQLFRDRIFSAAALNGFFCGMALFGAISFIPLFVQGVLSTDATEAGWSLTPLTLAWVIFSIISGRLILAIGYRKTVMAGMVSLTVGFFFLSRINGAISAGQLTVLMVLIGSGMGLSMISMLIAVQNRFPRHFLGVVTSLIQFFRTLGASVGIAIMGMVMAQKMVSQLSTLASSGQNGTLVYLARYPEMIVNPVDRQNFPASILEPLQNILGAALQDVFFVGFVISLLAFATAFLIPAGSASEHAINP